MRAREGWSGSRAESAEPARAARGAARAGASPTREINKYYYSKAKRTQKVCLPPPPPNIRKLQKSYKLH